MCLDWVREPLCKPNFLCIFVLRNTLGLRVKFVDSKKIFFNPPRKFMLLTVRRRWSRCFLFCVALWFILRGASCFEVFPCSLSSCFVISFSIVITSLGEEGTGLCASRAFVCLLCTCKFCHFSLSLEGLDFPLKQRWNTDILSGHFAVNV